MASHTFFGKQKLCYTEVTDFTDFQGIGRDPMYKRYDSVYSVIKRSVPEDLLHFLATPEYISDSDQICWHVEQWNDRPVRLCEMSGPERDSYQRIYEDCLNKYKSAILDLEGEDLAIMAGAIKYIDIDRAYGSDGKVYVVAWGMTPDTKQHKVIGSVIHDIEYVKKFKITFDEGEHGSFELKIDKSCLKPEGTILSENDLPKITPSDGWNFNGWEPSPVGIAVNSDLNFVAKYSRHIVEEPPIIINEPPQEPEDIYYNCTFDAGTNGTIVGSPNVQKLEGTCIEENDVPNVIPNKGYKFSGWNISPLNCQMNGNKVFSAQYEKILPWYKRFWLWLTGLFAGKGCLKWLLWILGIILLFIILAFLLRSCHSCSHLLETPVNGVLPIDTVKGVDGKYIDDNGTIHPVTGDDGVLPETGSIVAPVMEEGGEDIPVVDNPGVPTTIANRLFLFLENENDDVESLAEDFKKVYPGNQYSIIGYDKEVKLLVIKIPENERDQIRKTINSKIPNHRFIVFDEEIYELNGNTTYSAEENGWHLDAIHLRNGWSYTRGTPNVKIAVIDDGIQADHPMFKNRIVDAYNVFTMNNRLSKGQGHGTHTAGLAAGSSEFYSKGVSGIAPECMIMPIQVFDNKRCTLSSLVSGTMYAIHHDADVVNISIGPNFKGLNVLPVEQQDDIAKTQFQNVAALWARICRLASNKNCILVFAAGNDDILTSIPPENRNESSIVVTSVDSRMYPTEFTNYGPCSDVSAPGKSIYSSFPNSTFMAMDGTSMSAPIITGTVALMKSLKKDLSVEQARNVLFSTGADVYGWIPPMVLVDKALEATKNGNFKRIKRTIRPVPDGDGNMNSGRIPDTNENVIDRPEIRKPSTQTGDETDYDAIRRKIEEYKQKIVELEKLLPKK